MKDWTIYDIESLTESNILLGQKDGEPVDLLDKLDIKGHDIYIVDFGGAFGLSALVFKNGRHIHYANDETINSVEALVKYIEGYKEVAPEVAVRVKGGMVQSVYANADVNVEVYDLDVSDFPDEGEEDKAAEKEAELEKLVASPGWRAVW